MTTRLLFILLALPAVTLSQQVQQVEVFKKDTFNFKAIQVKVLPDVVKAFTRNNIQEFTPYTEYGHTLKELYNDLHFVDINNDGLADVIFQGYSGGEATLVKIFINNKNRYTKVFEDLQFIDGLTFENKN